MVTHCHGGSFLAQLNLIFMSFEYGLSSEETCGLATHTKGHQVLKVNFILIFYACESVAMEA
jgi:hypothetical protein